MVDAGLEEVARPILDDLVGQVDAFRLEEWEGADIVAPALALLYRCVDRLDGDTDTRRALYLRVCRLDPLAAMRFAPGAAEAEPDVAEP
jgi:hypothetical protein